ncbi:hypothetical protein [Streptomyces mirabilis]
MTFGPAGAGGWADAEWAELIEGESAVPTLVERVFDARDLDVESRIWDSFQVFVCWKDIRRRPCKRCRASRPIVIGELADPDRWSQHWLRMRQFLISG